jgi:hypothetical protein
VNDEMEACLGTRAFPESIDNTGFFDLLYGLTIIQFIAKWQEGVFKKLDLVFCFTIHGRISPSARIFEIILRFPCT